MPNKIVTAEMAAELIRSGDTVTTSGFVGIGVPEALLKALAARFLDAGEPSDLTLIFAAGQGDGQDRGLNHLAHDGLIKCVIGGHWGLIPKLARMATEGRIEAYNLPQGVISHLFRDIAAGKPGTLTHVGLETFVDPAQGGGKINAATETDIVERIEIAGETRLFYHARPIDVALLRGTTADAAGNITMEHEALTIDNLSQAMAAKNSGGAVVVQVERIVARGTLNPRDVIIPGAMVDAIVIADPADHKQTFATDFSHTFTGRYRKDAAATPPMELTPRKIIARRAAFELPINGIVNLGIGMPEGVAAVAGEEKLLTHLTLTAEPGVMGGQPASGLDFGAAENTDAILAQNQQFDFYDGGGLDIAILGMAEADGTGSVNVSRFGPRLAGAGGFINISQNARKVVFAGTFTSVASDLAVTDGALQIRSEGKVRKLVDRVEQVTFSGPRAARLAQPVIYVTERCVLRLGPQGLELIEIAPGVDLQRDILDQMAFAPVIHDLDQMDPRIFADGPMGLEKDLLHLDLDDRIVLDDDQTRIFINLEKMRIRDENDLDLIQARVETLCTGLPAKIDALVNYDHTVIYPEIEDAYAAMVLALEDRFYARVTRFSASAFARMKLGDLLSRDTRAHIFASAHEATRG